MGLNIGLYLRRSEGPIRKSEVTDTDFRPKGICLCKQETHVEDSSRALVTINQSTQTMASTKHGDRY
jgi:hypothetical protein